MVNRYTYDTLLRPVYLTPQLPFEEFEQNPVARDLFHYENISTKTFGPTDILRIFTKLVV